MKILYLHGFNSAGYGSKVTALRQQFGAGQVLNPTLPTQPQAALELLNYLGAHLPNLMVLGSSLGGYYALQMAKNHGMTAILVNPALKNLAPGLRASLGEQTNYKTGETYHFTEQDLSELEAMELTSADWQKISTHVFAYMDAEDEVLPSAQHADFLKSQGIYTRVFPGGDHLFQHMPDLLTDLSALISAGKIG